MSDRWPLPRMKAVGSRSFDDKNASWVTNDGRMMKVVDMNDDHIHNAVAKIKRSGNWRLHMLSRLEYELELRALGDNPTHEQLTTLRVKFTLRK